MADDKTSEQQVAFAISEAIRAKRGERKASSQQELAALEASLLADLESFQDSQLEGFFESEPAKVRPQVVAAVSKQFPELGGSVPRQESVRSQPAATAAPQPKPALGAGLLAQLRQQAEQVAQQSENESKDRAQVSRFLDEGLRRIFEYVNELVQQLNVLRPVIPRVYTLFGAIEFKDMAWQRGFVDYRTDSKQPGVVFEAVNFSFSLKTAKEVCLEREASAIESLRKILLDSGVVFRCEEKRNERHMVESAMFYLAPEVKSTLRWQADPEKRGVVLETRNFERFGDVRYFLPVDCLTHDMLEEFGRLLLGQANRFRDFAKR